MKRSVNCPGNAVNPTTDDLLVELKRLTLKGRRCINDGRWSRAEDIGGQVELITDQLFANRADYSPIILDGANFRARLAIYNGDIAEAEIHLEFVTNICLGRPQGEFTTQFADALEATVRVAMHRRDLPLLAASLERCAEVRRAVLGPTHPDTLRAEREWVGFIDIMTDPKHDGPPAEGGIAELSGRETQTERG